MLIRDYIQARIPEMAKVAAAYTAQCFYQTPTTRYKSNPKLAELLNVLVRSACPDEVVVSLENLLNIEGLATDVCVARNREFNMFEVGEFVVATDWARARLSPVEVFAISGENLHTSPTFTMLSARGDVNAFGRKSFGRSCFRPATAEEITKFLTTLMETRLETAVKFLFRLEDALTRWRPFEPEPEHVQ